MCVLNVDGITAKYHQEKIIAPRNEAKKTFPKKRRASLRKAYLLCVTRRNTAENTAPSAKAPLILNKSWGRKLGFKNADQKFLSHGHPSEVSINPRIPVIKKAEMRANET